MVTVIQASQLTLRDVKSRFNLQFEKDATFFPEWQNLQILLNDYEKEMLDRAQADFIHLTDNPVQEALVKMVVVSPLLSVAGFYRKPFFTHAEKSTEIVLNDNDETIRGRIDVLVVNQKVWITIVEAKGTQINWKEGLPQTLAYMMSNQDVTKPTFGLLTNGTDSTFLKLDRNAGRYGLSKTFSVFSPGNDLYEVTAVLKSISGSD